jgi:REP element-mobilizing transposase RayT
MFHHKNIRLPADRYIGTTWFFLTFCTERRKRVFLNPARANWFLDHFRCEALTHTIAIHAYCIMPDHVHLLSQGLTPTANLLHFLTSLKQKTAFAYKQETTQQLWQKKSYDHALRSTDPPDQVAYHPYSGSLTGARPGSAPPTAPWSPPWRTEPGKLT